MQPGTDARVAVALVARHGFGTRPRRAERLTDVHSAHDFFELRAFVDLPGRDLDGEGESVTVSNQVERKLGGRTEA